MFSKHQVLNPLWSSSTLRPRPRFVNLTRASISSIRDQIVNRSATARQITQRFLKAALDIEPRVHSYITIDEQGALEQADYIDHQIASGALAGPLAGVPIAVKDNIVTKSLRTTAGSKALAGHHPAYDATVVARLRAAGAVIIGKTNMDEFGMGSSTESSHFGVTRNPWDTERVPGGSSGGSAAAVAAGQCAAALGSDTGGSIRQPAHFCGVVGLKPTYGRVSRYGLIAYASSLDTIGPMTRTVADAAVIFQTIAGHDDLDSTCSTRQVEDFELGSVARLGDRPLEGRVFGVVSETQGQGVDPAIHLAFSAAVQHIEMLGGRVEEISLPSFEAGLPAYYVIALSEASSNLSRYDGVRYGERMKALELREMYSTTRAMTLGSEVKRRILMGSYALSAGYYDAYYKRAQQIRTLVQQELAAALDKYDALLSPVAPSAAYPLGSKCTDPLAMYKGDLMTVSINLAGVPALVVPCGTINSEGSALPVGVQFIGRAFGEKDLLSIGHIYEKTANFLPLKM